MAAFRCCFAIRSARKTRWHIPCLLGCIYPRPSSEL